MIRHKLRKGIVRSSVFLASQHWQYSGNGFHRLNQVYLILICAYGESFVTFIIFHLQIKTSKSDKYIRLSFICNGYIFK